MSAIITGRVFWTDFENLSYKDKQGKEYSIKDTTGKIVLLAIGDSADDYGENSWQSFETIAQKASISRRSAIRVVRALIENKYLKIAGITKYGTNNFTVNIEKLGEPPKRRTKQGRPKTSDSEAKTSDSEAKTSDGESPYPSFNHPLTKEEEGGQFSEVWKFYQNNFGMGGIYDHEQVGDLVDIHGGHWTLEAMKIAVKNNKRNIAYFSAILKRWGEENSYGTELKKNGNNGKGKSNGKTAADQPDLDDGFMEEYEAKLERARQQREMELPA